MTLRRRVAVIAAVGCAVVVLLGVIVASRFVDVVSAGTDAFGRLQSAADEADRLVLLTVQTEGDLQDLVLTGRPRYRAAVADRRAAADASLAALRTQLGDIEAVRGQLDAAAQARVAWWDVDAGPTIAAVAAGDLAEAARVTQTPAAWAAYDGVVATSTALQDAIDTLRGEALDQVVAFARELAWTLAAAGAILLGGLLVIVLLLHRWVLHPLDRLRRQVRAVAHQDRHRPIRPSGPPELAAAGTDAELMRRQLVAEIDEARAAREALAQDAPVVAAIRGELAAPADPAVPGLRIHGEVHPAEGVLAGDWWTCARRPTGSCVVALADVSGHGPAAGIAAMRIKHALDSSLAAGAGLDEALAVAVLAFQEEDARFATVVLIEVDPGTGGLSWANAGHPPPLLRRAGGEVADLPPTGPLLSTLGGAWSVRRDRLGPGDVLLACTDGLLESRAADGAELGDPGLAGLLAGMPAGAIAPAEAVARVVAAARRRAVDWRRDDITIVALGLAPASDPG